MTDVSAESPTPEPRKRRKLLPIIIAAAVVVVAGGAAGVYALNQRVEPVAATTSATPSPTKSPSPTPTPTPTVPAVVELPRTAAFRGTIEHWTLAPNTQVAAVLPAVGDAATGERSLYIDARGITGPANAAVIVVPVVPNTEYEFSASVRLLTPERVTVPASFLVGATPVSLPTLNAHWQEVTQTITTGAEETSLAINVALSGDVTGLSVDDVALTSPTGENLVLNPSFEQTAAEARVANDGLILPASTATMALSLPDGPATWTVTDDTGAVAAEGTVVGTGSAVAVPLTGVAQGYYNFAVAASDGQTTSTPFGVVDMGDKVAITKDDRFGVVTHIEEDTSEDAARTVAQMGVAWVRADILWNMNETTQGQYNWHPMFETEMARSKAYDINVLAAINYENPLYHDGRTPESSGAIDAFARYAAAVVEHYGVPAVEVWNEFNIKRFNTTSCGLSAACYMPMLRAVHGSVKAVNPETTVVAGAIANYDGEWLSGLWANGGMDYADAVSFHPYQVVYGTTEGLAFIYSDANTRMTAATGRTVPIWISELGWTTKTGDVSPYTQGQRLIRASTTTFSANVAKYMWYDLIDRHTDPASHEGNFGIFFRPIAEVAAQPPKFSAFSQALLIQQLNGATYTGTAIMNDTVRSIEFGTGAEAVHVAWAMKGSGTATYTTTTPITITDPRGKVQEVAPVDGVVNIELSEDPVFVTGVTTPGSIPTPTPPA